MGIHIFDTPFKSLDLSDPLWVEAECRAPNGFGHAEQNKVSYGFAPTKYTTGDFTFTWWDGAGAPRHDKNPDLKLPKGENCQSKVLSMLEKGVEWCCHIAACQPSIPSL